jgi:hypothetical protein
MPRRGLALARLIKGSLARYIFPNFWSSAWTFVFLIIEIYLVYSFIRDVIGILMMFG